MGQKTKRSQKGDDSWCKSNDRNKPRDQERQSFEQELIAAGMAGRSKWKDVASWFGVTTLVFLGIASQSAIKR